MFFPHGRGGKRAPAGSAAGRRPSGDVPTCSKATPQPGAQPGAPLSESVAPSLSRTRCSLLGPSRADSAGRATPRGPSPRRWRPSLQLPPPPRDYRMASVYCLHRWRQSRWLPLCPSCHNSVSSMGHRIRVGFRQVPTPTEFQNWGDDPKVGSRTHWAH